MAKSNYFSNTHALQTRPTINGIRSLVAYCNICALNVIRSVAGLHYCSFRCVTAGD